MSVTRRILRKLCVPALPLALTACPRQASADIERFLPRQAATTEVWRVTDDPTMRDWANYHNAQCFSHDGRYLCYTHYQPYGSSSSSKIHLYDLHKQEDIKVDQGSGPRWANNHDWLFYIRRNPLGNGSREKATQVMWLDVDTNKLVPMSYGFSQLGGTDCEDRWLFGGRTTSRERQGMQGFRVAIRPSSEPEILEGLRGIQWMPNPAHPVVFVRWDHYDEPQGDDYWLTKGTRYWFDLEGKNVTVGSPQIQRCHQSWLGDGSYHLHGGTPMAGRRWNEPFPSNLHFLAAIGCGDISPCGRSGRWISGSGNYGSLQVADVRSGDGWDYLSGALSLIHDSDDYAYAASSALHDCDAKGSPDGTKILFVSNYDLKDGPVTEITNGSRDRIDVKSTDGFPEQGALSLPDEVIRYERKTATSFEGLTRRLYRRGSANLRPGRLVTSFEARCIPEELREEMALPSRFAQRSFPDKGSPLIWQRRTDIYVAIVRLPDRPALRAVGHGVELIPGANHWETRGYHVLKEGKRLTDQPLLPGTTFSLPEAGAYAAVAVEWSGLESKPGVPFTIHGPSELRVCSDAPDDFSWTADRWLVDGQQVSVEAAKRSAEAVREIVHRHDGVIHREWHDHGQIRRRHDLSSEGKVIRRLFYQDGVLARREYHNREGNHVSTELFDPDGYITESIQYRDSEPAEHFWFERGMPVKFTGSRSHHAAPHGRGTYVKKGDNWVKQN